jgi:hypothetical protein
MSIKPACGVVAEVEGFSAGAVAGAALVAGGFAVVLGAAV